MSLRGPSRARNATSGGQPGRVGCCRLYGLSCRAGEEKRSGEHPACDPGQPRSSKDWRWREAWHSREPAPEASWWVRSPPHRQPPRRPRPTHTCLSLAPATGAPTGGGMGESRARRGGTASLPPEGIMGACIAGKPNKFGAATGLAERMGGHASICTAPATSHSSLARRLQTNEPSARRQVGREAR